MHADPVVSDVSKRQPASPRETPVDLAAVICTKDNMRTIERTLQSVQTLARRIIVVDSGSTDGTIERCRAYGADVEHRDWDNHASQKRYAMSRCDDCAWILLLDSDEAPEPELVADIRRVVESDAGGVDGYEVNRKVWFLGGWLHHTFQPEWRMRLVRRGAYRVAGAGENDPKWSRVHERLEVEGKTGRLRGDLRHDSWANLRDFCQRNIGYAELAARSDVRGGRLINIVINPPATLFKQLVLRRGILDGARGVIAAGGMASAVLLKHLFLLQQRAKLDETSTSDAGERSDG